jgi:hypothetical protein
MEVFDKDYINIQRKKLVNVYINIIGFESLTAKNYIKYSKIQNEESLAKIMNLLPALRTVFQTYEIRSITNRRNDKHLVLNLLRQLLKTQNYKLKSKTFHLHRNNKITSSCKYIIVPIEQAVHEALVQDTPDTILNLDEMSEN